jgi:hypothetical protein
MRQNALGAASWRVRLRGQAFSEELVLTIRAALKGKAFITLC